MVAPHTSSHFALTFARPIITFLVIWLFAGLIPMKIFAQDTSSRTLRGHHGEIFALAFSPDGQRAVWTRCYQVIQVPFGLWPFLRITASWPRPALTKPVECGTSRQEKKWHPLALDLGISGHWHSRPMGRLWQPPVMEGVSDCGIGVRVRSSRR